MLGTQGQIESFAAKMKSRLLQLMGDSCNPFNIFPVQKSFHACDCNARLG